MNETDSYLTYVIFLTTSLKKKRTHYPPRITISVINITTKQLRNEFYLANNLQTQRPKQ